MRRELGVAYCGLVCALCSENENCVGCQKRGCGSADTCKNLACCSKQQIPGCYACNAFPCQRSMLDNPRIYAFAKFCGQYGETFLLDCLERNEKQGIHYHIANSIKGDYDDISEAEIVSLLLHGTKKPILD